MTRLEELIIICKKYKLSIFQIATLLVELKID